MNICAAYDGLHSLLFGAVRVLWCGHLYSSHRLLEYILALTCRTNVTICYEAHNLDLRIFKITSDVKP